MIEAVLKALLRRVDGVELAVVDHDADADDREADQGALGHRFFEALVAGRNELARNRATDGVVDELVLLDGIGRQRLDVADDAGELALAAGLLPVGVGEIGLARDGLAIRDLRLAGDDLALVLALHALDVDVEVKLAHAGHDGLRRLFVAMHAQRRVFFGEAVEGPWKKLT